MRPPPVAAPGRPSMHRAGSPRSGARPCGPTKGPDPSTACAGVSQRGCCHRRSAGAAPSPNTCVSFLPSHWAAGSISGWSRRSGIVLSCFADLCKPLPRLYRRSSKNGRSRIVSGAGRPVEERITSSQAGGHHADAIVRPAVRRGRGPRRWRRGGRRRRLGANCRRQGREAAEDGGQRLPRHFEDRRGEVAGDAVVAPGAGEPRGQEAGIERPAAGGMARQHGGGVASGRPGPAQARAETAHTPAGVGREERGFTCARQPCVSDGKPPGAPTPGRRPIRAEGRSRQSAGPHAARTCSNPG